MDHAIHIPNHCKGSLKGSNFNTTQPGDAKTLSNNPINPRIMTRKALLAIVTLVTTFSLATAQDTHNYIGISLGPSFPIGDYGSKDADNENGGLANTGAIFDLSYAYRFGQGPFGVTAMIRGQANLTDAQALANIFANQFPGITWTVESDPWTIGCLMVGGFASFNLSGKTSFDARAMIGLAAANSPELNISANVQGIPIWVKQSSTYGSSAAFLVGAGFKFALGNRLYLLANLDYMGLKPEFEDVETIGSDGSRSFDTWSQPMATLNAGVGIAFRF